MKWLILILITTCALAQDIDTFIYNLSPDSNFGNNPYIYVSTRYINGDRAVGLIKWDIPETEVSSATIKLYCTSNSGPQEIWVSHVLLPWDEDTITWNDRVYLCAIHLHIVYNPEENEWLNINITDTVNMWIRGENPNYGLGILIDTYGAYVVFCSSDYYQGNYHPRLVCFATRPCNNPCESTINSKSLGRIKSVFR